MIKEQDSRESRKVSVSSGFVSVILSSLRKTCAWEDRATPIPRAGTCLSWRLYPSLARSEQVLFNSWLAKWFTDDAGTRELFRILNFSWDAFIRRLNSIPNESFNFMARSEVFPEIFRTREIWYHDWNWGDKNLSFQLLLRGRIRVVIILQALNFQKILFKTS